MHDFVNPDESALQVVTAPSIFAKGPLMRLNRKRLGPTVDLKVGRRELAKARATEVKEEVEEDTPRPFA